MRCRGYFVFGLILSLLAAEKTDAAERAAVAAEEPIAPKPISVAKPVVVIDPGHGGADPGAVVERVVEKDLVLDYGIRIAKALKQGGTFEVFLTRSTDEFVSLDRRIRFAIDKNAIVFISLHVEPGLPDVSGAIVYTPQKGIKGASVSAPDLSDVFSKFLVGHLAGAGVIHNNPFRSASFKVFNGLPSKTARVVIELGNPSNLGERKVLLSPARREAFAAAVAGAVEGMHVLTRQQ